MREVLHNLPRTRYARYTAPLLAAFLLLHPLAISPAVADNDNKGNTKGRLEEEENKRERKDKEEGGKNDLNNARPSQSREAIKDRRPTTAPVRPIRPVDPVKPVNAIDEAIEKCIAEKTDQYQGAKFEPNSVIVGFKPHVSLDKALAVFKRQKVQPDLNDPNDVALFEAASILVAREARQGVFPTMCRFLVMEDKTVRFVEPDLRVRALKPSRTSK